MATLAELWDAPSAGPNLSGLKPELADRLNQAAAAYKQQFGKDLPITSKTRTRKSQASPDYQC